MGPIVITEINTAATLYRLGLLKYFNSNNLSIHITDICYNHKGSHDVLTLYNNKMLAKRMEEQGFLKVVELTEIQMKQVAKLYSEYKPKFVVKTISALVYAHEGNMKVISEDELLGDVARGELNLKVYNQEWFVDSLLQELVAMGVKIDSSQLKEMIQYF
ncbi:hypothetical protein FJM65_19215 [Pontibacter mangrovi]|uniref:Uncharacterized protein n=3 Tax=Pseudomonadati TaxID=3379134 RepID=A0A501WGF2_9RHOB|nr:hypothetical protein FJM65_19215 [Pontibacter mangrovi]TPE48659.1 hypothetical protein FJM51_17015 [Amaricoccus solimangrovi]